MNDVIVTNNLSKRYRIGEVRKPYGNLRDTLVDACKKPFQRMGREQKHAGRAAKDNLVWALDDATFKIKRGEVVGIIGRNGAGKSTLLKILSRITEPTRGFAEIDGRVSSLLEVGTGFHAELTGRENIFLNGAILGMRRREMERKFDAIVAFAEVDKFVDMPVKFYSSGMYLRLAFAVAAHLDPDILLIDEVLAVGDAAFQKKCLGQMGNVAREGRTVLFVSHNMAAVRSLCSRGILLEHGKVAYDGEAETAIAKYNSANAAPAQAPPQHGPVGFTGVRINQKVTETVSPDKPFEVTCRLHLRSELVGFYLFCTIQDSGGEQIAVVATDHRHLGSISGPGDHDVVARFPGLWLRTGVYSVSFKLIASFMGNPHSKFVSDVAMLDVLGDSHPGVVHSYLMPHVDWTAEPVRFPSTVGV